MNTVVDFWQQLPFKIDPVIVSFAGFEIRYYGLMYVLAFATAWALMRHYRKKYSPDITPRQIDDYIFWAILGVLIGGRLGYVLFYDMAYYLAHPLEIILPVDFSGGFHVSGFRGMSFHGGLLGVVVMTVIYCRKQKIPILYLGDLIAAATPLAYTFGRLGNFLNGELYGRATDVPWGMYFPSDSTRTLRHPSQLYEAFFEGIVLFFLLKALQKKQMKTGAITGFYIAGYGVMRFFIEFVREPDAHLGFVAGFMTMGQVLCFFMTAIGLLLIFRANKRKN